MAAAVPRKTVLVVYHTRTGVAGQISCAMAAGARTLEPDSRLLTVRRLPCHRVNEKDLLRADGYLFAAPENLAGLSGSMKEFFDRNYYGMFDDAEGGVETSALTGRPYGALVAGGSDGTSAITQLRRICQGWRLRPVVGKGEAGGNHRDMIVGNTGGGGAEDGCARRLEEILHNGVIKQNAAEAQTKANILRRKGLLDTYDRMACERLGALVAARLLIETW
eukprot:g15080.t1